MIQQGWLRALLFVLLGFPLTFVIGFGIDIIANGMYGNDFAAASVDISAFLKDYIIKNIAIIFIVWLFRIWIDNETFYSLGFEWKGHQLDAWTGLFGALLVLFVGSLILVINKNLYFTNVFFNFSDFTSGIILFISIAFVEEIVFRGYLLNNLLQSMNQWWALIITAAVFTIMHIQNYQSNILSVTNIFIAGLVLGINYIYTKNLWFSVFFHFGWNFFQGSVLGYPISGINVGSGIMQQSLNGAERLTGGDFGFEGSIFCTSLLAFMLIIFSWRFNSNKINTVKEEI
ncbi:MAG: CPBP family intramembrane metalloprotease [Bacteroidota bacterium]|nr:CPBP family intramembrane metalloprotease [Bacteroidota bacterium]